METNEPKKRGGAREGAGRPRVDTRQLGIRMGAKTLEKLERLAQDARCTKAQFIERLILDC